MKNKVLLGALSVVAFATVSTINSKPAQAFRFWRTQQLGITTIEDNKNYWRSKTNGRTVLETPPRNRDHLCRWKTGYRDAKGQPVSRSSRSRFNLQTRCYRR